MQVSYRQATLYAEILSLLGSGSPNPAILSIEV